MRTHIDWLTFTIPMIYFGNEVKDYADAIQAGFMDMFPVDLVASVFGGSWEKNERSRAPYTDSWRDRDGGITLFASPNLTHAWVEISGEGCEALLAMGKMQDVLYGCRERVTRIDIACDIETDVRPTEFVEQTSHGRMRTSGYQQSDTGETCYVGSKKSDRYARVYRYYEPHPRAKLLRVEHVFRRDYSRVIASAIVENGLVSVAAQAGKAFGWVHRTWDISAGSEQLDLSITKPERNAGTTVSWLVRSVAPAFKRLCANGTIPDPEQFIVRYFLP